MFELNRMGGWIVPQGTTLEAGTDIPAFSTLGNDCKLGNGCTLGNYCKLGNGCTLGDGCTLGNCCTFGDCCDLGDDCIFGDYCKLGNDCTFGDYCKLGDYCTLGYELNPGEHLQWLGAEVESFLTLSNVDGSGRQVKLVKHVNSTVMVEAGCFLGTVDEFVAKAEDEGKLRYARLIPLIAANM